MSRGPAIVAAVATSLAVALVLSLTAFRGGRSHAEVGRLIATGFPLYCGGGERPYDALTFDDGPTRRTPQLVQVLRANRAGATFFEIGRKAVANPRLVRLEASIGEVGNHTWSHPSLTDLANERVVGQFARTQNALERVTGKRPHLYRPPFEAHNFRVDGIAAGLGLLTVLWNVDSGDASVASTPSAEVVFRNLVRRVRPGAIVLLHEDETVPTTVRALRRFLPELRRRGLDAVSVSELVTRDPPDAQELPNGSGGCNSTWHR